MKVLKNNWLARGSMALCALAAAISLCAAAAPRASAEDTPRIATPRHDPFIFVIAEEENRDCSFHDVSERSWYYDAACFVESQHLMYGTSRRNFDPMGTMTRSMAWTVLARMTGMSVNGEDWYGTAQDWATTNGVSDGLAGSADVTREEFIAMLWRNAGRYGCSASLEIFTDGNTVSDWAVEAVKWAVDTGMIKGSSGGMLNPQESITRAEAAQMLYRYLG